MLPVACGTAKQCLECNILLYLFYVYVFRERCNEINILNLSITQVRLKAGTSPADNMYLLTEWEGRTGKYLARGQDVRTERSKVRTFWPRAKYFSVRPDLTLSISILSYDHLCWKFWKFCLNLNRTRLHNIRRPIFLWFSKEIARGAVRVIW